MAININSLWLNKKLTVRAPINPMDKSTVVSIYPREILERKETIFPSNFLIPAGSFENPSVLTVGPSSWFKELDHGQPDLEIVNHSLQIAESLVKDYCNGMLLCDMNDKMPGLFFVMGPKTAAQIKTEHQKELLEAKRKQNNWFEALVKLADSLWSRSNGNPIAIGDDMRMAAKHLGRIDKDWMRDFSAIETIRCVACGTMIQNTVIICPTCKVVLDKKRFDELKLTLAS